MLLIKKIKQKLVDKIDSQNDSVEGETNDKEMTLKATKKVSRQEVQPMFSFKTSTTDIKSELNSNVDNIINETEARTSIKSKQTVRAKDSMVVKKELKTAIVKEQPIANESDCIIVIGVFEQESNKTNIINKLRQLGYSNEQGLMKNGLSYVGVPVGCDNKTEKRKLIGKLNNEFNVQTWIKKK